MRVLRDTESINTEIKEGRLFDATRAQSERDAQAILYGNCSGKDREGHDTKFRLGDRDGSRHRGFLRRRLELCDSVK